jgi:glycosyltransferase involved in cell wall biosynthesis
MSSLVILTSRYPYPPGEEFLKNEVEELAKYFTSIKIIPTNSEMDQNEKDRKQILKNAEVIILPSLSNGKFGLIFKLLSDHQALAWFKEEFSNASRHGIKAVLKLLNWTAISSQMKQKIKNNRHIDIKGDNVFYSYWLTPSATALAMLKEQNLEMKVVSRVHGGDLYLERHQPAYLPYQGKVIQMLNQTFSISENGKNYLSKLYPENRQKISVNRLGTKNEMPFENQTKEATPLKLISCSYLKSVKRVHLLVEALKYIDFPIHWTHIGDGPEREKIEMMVNDLPGHIQVKLMGNLPNDRVMDLYKTNQYDLFINVSESEGIPVTIMEAFSYGIPAIATNVGGTSELVHSENGYLLSKDFDPKDLAQILQDYARMDLQDQNQKAQSAYDTWDHNYNAVKNYKKFAEDLKGVTN